MGTFSLSEFTNNFSKIDEGAVLHGQTWWTKLQILFFFHKSAKVHMSVIGIVSSIRLLILAHFWILSMQSQINWQDTLVGMHVCCNKNSLWDIDRNPLALCSITITTIFSTSDTNLCWYLGEKKVAFTSYT